MLPAEAATNALTDGAAHIRGMTDFPEQPRLINGVPGAGRFTFGDKPVGTRALSALPTNAEVEAEAVEAVSELYSVVAAVEFEPAPDDLGPGGSFTHLKSVQFVDGLTLNREDTGAVSGEDVLSIMEHSLKERVGANWERMADLGQVKVRELGTPAPAGGYGDPGW